MRMFLIFCRMSRLSLFIVALSFALTGFPVQALSRQATSPERRNRYCCRDFEVPYDACPYLYLDTVFVVETDPIVLCREISVPVDMDILPLGKRLRVPVSFLSGIGFDESDVLYDVRLDLISYRIHLPLQLVQNLPVEPGFLEPLAYPPDGREIGYGIREIKEVPERKPADFVCRFRE